MRTTAPRRAPWILALLVSAASPLVHAETLALHPVERRGPADPAYEEAQVALLKALTKLAGAPVLPARVRKPCEINDDACLSGVAKASRVDAIVTGAFERFPDGYSVHLRRIAATGAGRGEFRKLLPGGAPDLVAIMELGACQLVGRFDCTARIVVEAPDDVTLSADGRELGRGTRTLDLPLGRHVLRATRATASTPDRYLALAYQESVKLFIDTTGGGLAFATAAPAAPVAALPPLDDEMPALPDLDATFPPLELEPAPAAPPAPPPVAPAPPPVLAAPPPVAPPPAPVVVVAEPPPAPLATESETVLAIPDGDPVRGTARVPVLPPPPPERPRSAAWIPTATLATATGGGVAVLLGFVFGGIAGAQAADVNAKFAARTLRPSDAPTYDAARTNAFVSNVLYGLGALSLATSGVLFALDPEATLQVAGAGGDAPFVAVTWSGSFE